MLAIARQLSSDFFGLRRACGFSFAARWLAQVVRHLPTCIKRRDLQAAGLNLPDESAAIAERFDPEAPQMRADVGRRAIAIDPDARQS